jgi:uncharacterized UPF0160 family protein
MQNTENITIASHGGGFHADDVYATAVLLMLHPGATVIRTRDPEAIRAATFAVDVGGVWEPAEGRFDHHQKGFNGRRLSGVAYASSGLVWLQFGKTVIGRVRPDLDDELVSRIRTAIDQELVQYLDMADTGAATSAPGFFGLSALIASYNPTRSEEKEIRASARTSHEADQKVRDYTHNQFMEGVALVQRTIIRLIATFADEFQCESLVRHAVVEADGEILVLPESGLVWENIVCKEMPKVLFVVYPDSSDKQYQVRTVPVAPQSFIARKNLPAAWAGLRDADLARVTGVPDSVFCHNGLFIAGAVSQESAVQLACLALWANG